MEMKTSFLQAGFDESQCRYRVFDNSTQNLHDPYGVINAVLAEATEPYVIFCHQDILIDQCDNFGSLVRLIEEMDVIDPNWAILGNAGGSEKFDLAIRISDPHGKDVSQGNFPQRVQTLDENFLVIKSASQLQCSAKLRGFHLYGTDLCLNAMSRGLSCYVVDFHLTHLSAGNAREDFQNALKMVQQEHNKRFVFYYVRTTCALFFLSRFLFLRRCFGNGRVIEWMRFHPGPYIRCLMVSKKIMRWVQIVSGRSLISHAK